MNQQIQPKESLQKSYHNKRQGKLVQGTSFIPTRNLHKESAHCPSKQLICKGV